MSLRDWFKSRKRLEAEREWAWSSLDRLNHAIDSVRDLDELKKFAAGEMAKEPVLVMPGSDIGQGELRLKHWASKLMARAAMDTLNSFPDADNYLVVTMDDPKTGKMLDVTFQRKEYGKLTPSEKATKLQKEVDALKAELETVRKAG